MKIKKDVHNMDYRGKNIKVFTGNANPNLAENICKFLKIPMGEAEVGRFSDGEIKVTIKETVRGSDVYVVQSLSTPVNDHLMELLILCDAFRRASAGRITVVIPYLGYARQDRKSKARDPISAKLVADLITVAGADRVLTMDLHAAQIQGFFNIPVDHLLGTSILAPCFAKQFGDISGEVVVVSPDLGSVTRARKFAERIGVPIAIIDKRRPTANVSEVVNIIGSVKNKTVLLVDDLIDTAGTLCNAAKAIMERGGAKKVFACATHGVLSGPAIERIAQSPIETLTLLDTIVLPPEKQLPKIRVLSSAPLIAEAIRHIYDETPVSVLFD